MVTEHSIIGSDFVLGKGVTVGAEAQLWFAELEDDVAVGPASVIGSPPPKRRRAPPEEGLRVYVCQGVDIGANATIAPGVRIGRGAVVRPGAVVLRDVPPWAVAQGNPATVVGYAVENQPTASTTSGRSPTQLPGKARLLNLRLFSDLRGSLVVADFKIDALPFTPERVFWTFDIPSPEVRGEHAHRTTEELIICVAGQCSVVLDDGRGNRMEVLLDRPELALHLPPMVWASEYKFLPGSVEVVLASEAYNERSYIRDYGRFVEEVRLGEGKP